MYEEAISRLEYIELIKARLISLFLELVGSPENYIYLDKSAIEHIIACINELIDEMFYDEFRYCSLIVDHLTNND